MQDFKDQLQHINNLRLVIEYLWDGNQEAFNIIYYIKSHYKQWATMLLWLKRNNLRGQLLVDFFKNESDESGGGYLLGCTLILSRISGHKDTIRGVKINDLY